MAAKTVEQWAAEKESEAWQVNAARVKYHWGEGREISESDFDAAVADVSGFTISDPSPRVTPKPNQ